MGSGGGTSPGQKVCMFPITSSSQARNVIVVELKRGQQHAFPGTSNDVLNRSCPFPDPCLAGRADMFVLPVDIVS